MIELDQTSGTWTRHSLETYTIETMHFLFPCRPRIWLAICDYLVIAQGHEGLLLFKNAVPPPMKASAVRPADNRGEWLDG